MADLDQELRKEMIVVISKVYCTRHGRRVALAWNFRQAFLLCRGELHQNGPGGLP